MYPENPEGTQVIVGSMNMGYISDTARNRTHNLFRPKREPIPLGHSDRIFVLSHMYPENPERNWVIKGSINMGNDMYIRNYQTQTRNLFHLKREPILLGHTDKLLLRTLKGLWMWTGPPRGKRGKNDLGPQPWKTWKSPHLLKFY